MKKLTIKVGEKIKTLRKSLNMTQSELAGSEMTKSMLSQIENNVSNPSMKTLNYIAGRLNKPITYFFEDNDNIDFKYKEKSNKELEDNIKIISKLIDSNNIEESEKLLQEIINDSNFKKIKIYADILLKFSDSLIKLNKYSTVKKYLNLSLECYIHEDLYLDATRAYIKLGKVSFGEFNYEKSLNIFDEAFECYYKSIIKDPSLEIELYHYKILILSAIGHINEALKALNTAINLSIETSIYYKTDELYRLNGIFHYFIGNKDEYVHSIEKALQFANFSKNYHCLSSIYIVLAIAALDANDPKKALLYTEEVKFYGQKLKDDVEKGLYIYYLLKGRAFYLLKDYKLAYENIQKIDFPSNVNHKFDYLNMWSSKIYEGLILSKLEKHTEGIAAIKIGIEKMSFMDNSKFLVSAYKSLSEVYSNIGDFENAFISLKKSNEIQDTINKDGSIFF
jgi:transcriptional regulator with XRE-family HTH domain